MRGSYNKKCTVLLVFFLFFSFGLTAATFALKKVNQGAAAQKESYLRYTAATNMVELGNIVQRSMISFIQAQYVGPYPEGKIQFTANNRFLLFHPDNHMISGTRSLDEASTIILHKVGSEGAAGSISPRYVLQDKLLSTFLDCDGAEISQTPDRSRACQFELVQQQPDFEHFL